MCIYDNCLGGYVYIKYATESPNTGASNKLYITCRHAGHFFKFKHNMSRGSFSWHILPTYIVVRRSVGKPGSSCHLTSFFTPFDLTGFRIAWLPKDVSSCRVKSEGVKIVVKRLEEPGFPATQAKALNSC